MRELEQQLQQHGFADLREVQRWLQKRWGVSSTYSGVGYGVRRNRVFESLEALEAAVWEALRVYQEHLEVLISLTRYPWWWEAVKK